MILTQDQLSAIEAIKKLQAKFPEGGGLGIISGQAGTGKSTVIRYIGEEFEDILVVAPTGKAALRVKELASVASKTIHSWLYTVSEDMQTGEPRWSLKGISDMETPGCGFLLVDEASMVTAEVFAHLKTRCHALNLNLILIGDGFQLPPVETDESKQGFSVFNDDIQADFRVELREIHRQAMDSPIIRACTGIRQGKWFDEALEGIESITRSAFNDKAQQVLDDDGFVVCHRNVTRHILNAQVRKHLGLPDKNICRGEPLSVTRNNYNFELYNGEIIKIRHIAPLNLSPVSVHDKRSKTSTSTNYLKVGVFSAMKGNVDAAISDKECYGALGDVSAACVDRGSRAFVGKNEFLHVNFGYVISAHRAQGSQAKTGIVCIEPSVRLNSTEGRKWLYVALSRFERDVKVFWTT